VILVGIALWVLSGCGFSGSATGASAPVALFGTVNGGQQPVGGASIQLYAAGTSGSGSAAQPLLNNPVQSDSNGNFSIPASYTCPSPTAQVYVVASGGNPGLPLAESNPALKLTAMLGSCNSLSALASITVNEVTTIGSVWPLAGFMTSSSHLGSEPNDTSFLNAVSTVPEYINITQGTSPGKPTSTSYFAENSKLYSLADLLADCVTSTGGSAGDGSPCGLLFSIATPPGGSAPNDTMTAALRIAQSPGDNVTDIFGLAKVNTCFRPALGVAPDDWTLSLTYIVATPAISLATGSYVGTQEVSMSDQTTGSIIHYTTDGTLPTSSSPSYTGPLTIAISSTIQAIAVFHGSQSAVASSTLTITPTPQPGPGKLAFTQQPSNAMTQATISPAVKVAVEDANGNVISSAMNPIRLSLWGNATGLGGTLSVTPHNGIATFNNLTVSKAGIGYTLSATGPGLTSAASTRFTISQSSTPPTTISVALTPGSVTLKPLQTQTFTASVSGTSNQSVTWSMSPSEGSIAASGLYIAPAVVPPSATVTITATSVSDPTNSASATVTIVPPQAAGYSLAWQDTFSTLSLCSTNVPGCNWYDPGIWNYSANGVITDPSGTYVNLNWLNTQRSNYTNMTTASMNGAYFHSWTFGYIEISMAFNPATGNWPALWMLPVKWNQSKGANYSDGLPYGELDLFEWFSDHPTLGYSTVHVWERNSDIANNYGTNTWQLPAGTTLSNFNTYGVLWTPTAISWYFNNHLVETFSTTGAHFNAVFAGQQSYALILSEQSGCNGVYGLCSDDTLSSPLDMQVQWVHIYASPATAQ
jgi:beta-glucanase (GH16 family)